MLIEPEPDSTKTKQNKKFEWWRLRVVSCVVFLTIVHCCIRKVSLFVFAAAFVVCALGGGEITLTGVPKGKTVNCGASFTVNFNYTAADVPDGSSLNITLVIEDFGKNEIVVAQLGKVVAPAKSFGVAIPQPFPADWVGGEKLKDNKGSSTEVTIEIIKSDDASVTSYRTVADDPEFYLVCCPITDAVSCGCNNCNCATNDTCAMGLACTDPFLGSKKCRPMTTLANTTTTLPPNTTTTATAATTPLPSGATPSPTPTTTTTTTTTQATSAMAPGTTSEPTTATTLTVAATSTDTATASVDATTTAATSESAAAATNTNTAAAMTDSNSNSIDVPLIAGVAGGAVVLLAVVGVAVAVGMRRRAKSAPSNETPMSATSVVTDKPPQRTSEYGQISTPGEYGAAPPAKHAPPLHSYEHGPISAGEYASMRADSQASLPSSNNGAPALKSHYVSTTAQFTAGLPSGSNYGHVSS